MESGLRNFVVFPAVADRLKDTTATYSYSPDNFYLKMAREIKARFPECCLISDVAMIATARTGTTGWCATAKS